jgi:hypothetical protein
MPSAAPGQKPPRSARYAREIEAYVGISNAVVADNSLEEKPAAKKADNEGEQPDRMQK